MQNLFWIPRPLLGQLDDNLSNLSFGGDTIPFLRRTQDIAAASYETWNEIWDLFFGSDIWKGLVIVGLLIAGISLILAALEWFPELSSQTFDGRRTFRLFAPIFAVVIVLGNNGLLLSQLLRAIRVIGVDIVNLPLKLSLLRDGIETSIENIDNVPLGEFIARLAVESSVIEALQGVTNPCRNETGTLFRDCMEQAWEFAASAEFLDQAVGDVDEITLDRVMDYINALRPTSFGPGVDGTDTGLSPGDFGIGAADPMSTADPAVEVVQELLNPIGLLFSSDSPNVEQFLAATQAAFVNGLEVVLIGAFALSPVVVALLLTSRGGQALFSWVSGIAGLYATQLIYNTTIGVISLFIYARQGVQLESGESVVSALAGLDQETFAIFVSIMAPLISLNLGYGQFARALSGSFGTARFLRDPDAARDQVAGGGGS